MRFTVEESVRGKLGQTVTVETGRGGGDCGTPLHPGERFLIFAMKANDGTLQTGLCMNNQLLTGDSKTAAILEPIRKIITPGKGSLFGTVTYETPQWYGDRLGESQAQIPGLVLYAKSETTTQTARTAKDGGFAFEGLPNSSYTVTPQLQEGWVYDDRHFQDLYVKAVSDGSCEKIDFQVRPSTRIKGRVSTPHVTDPAVGVIVVAIPTNVDKTTELSGAWGIDFPDGRFDIWPLPPGDYFVGINITRLPTEYSPFPPTYYPGVNDIKAARVVHVEEGGTKEIEFAVPELAQPRTVHYVAVGPDGEPFRHVRLMVQDSQRPSENVAGVNADLDPNGSGTLSVFAGFSYVLYADHWEMKKAWCAKPVVIPAGSQPVEVRFVLEPGDGSCKIPGPETARSVPGNPARH